MSWPESRGFPPPPPEPGTDEPSGDDPAAAEQGAALLGQGGPRWGTARALGGIALALFLTGVAAALAVGIDPNLESLGATLALQGMVAAVFVGVAFYIAAPGPGSADAAELGLRRPYRPAVKAAVAAYLVYIGCAVLINTVLDPEQEDIARDLGLGEGVLGTIAAGVMIIVVASVSEEIFFRGFVFAGLRRNAPFAVAALVSAFIWALLHFNPDDPVGSWGVVAQLTVLGVALAWLYERTGSIWPAIAVHALNNAIAFSIAAAA